MIFLLRKPHDLSSMSAKSNMSLLEKIVNTPYKIWHFLVGVCSAAIALPLVTLAIMLSVFLPQEKWEEFWDKFLES